MEILLIRSTFKTYCTIGKLFIAGDFFCFTMEDVVRDLSPDCSGKVPGKTAIPYGRYEVVMTYSNRFSKYMPLLLNVPCFSGIRMHGGNTEASTSGCVCVGQNTDDERIWNCSSVVEKLSTIIKSFEKKEKIFITIKPA